MKNICILFLIVIGFVINAASVDLIKNGKSNMVIVIQDGKNPLLKMAGREFADALKKRTDADIKIITAAEKLPANSYPFYLGLSEKTKKLGADEKKIKYDGYFLKITDKYAVIAGRDKAQTREPYFGHTVIYCRPDLGIYQFGEKGTLHGVYKFLEKYAGVRHYMPGELGSIIPTDKNFTVKTAEYYDAPAFAGRMFGAVWFSIANPDFLYWHHRMCAGGLRNPINHSYNRMGRFKKTNPEFFALIGGQRDFKNLSTANHYGNLCMTNKEGIKAFAKLAQDFFDRNPDYDIYPVVPQDGLFKVCECPDCRKLLSPHLGEKGIFSNIVFHHAAEIAKIVKKTHPDKFIGVLAYEKYLMPPKLEIPDNMYVCICYRRQNMRTAEGRKATEDLIKAYKKRKAKMLVWTYELYNHIPPMRGIPVLYSAMAKENINFNLNNNVVGEKAEGWYYSGGGDQYVKRFDFGLPASTHINDYIRCQLLWDPAFDVKAALDEYYKLFYGPAASEMKKFWQTAEELFMKRGEATVYTCDDIKLFEKLMHAAYKKAAPTSVYGKRIKLLIDELTPFFKTMYLIKSSSRTVGIPVVNGDIPMQYSKNNVWKYAPEYKLTLKSGNAAPSDSTTLLYVLANKKGLALYITAKEPHIEKLVKNTKIRDDGPTWKDDGYELFLITQDRSVNLHYLITAGSNIMDGKRTVDVNTSDWSWNSKLKLVQTEKGKVRTSMIHIPWSDLGYSFDKMPPLMLQLLRRQTNGSTTDGKYHVLFPTAGFHNYSPEYFGNINFMSPANMIENPSFEKLDSNGNAAVWSKNKKVLNDGVDGKKCIRLSAVGKNIDDAGSNTFAVKEGSEYMLHFSKKGGANFAYALFFNSKNKTVAEPNVAFRYIGRRDNWTWASFRGKVPKGAVKCRVIIRSFEKKAENAALIDNVQFFTAQP